MRLTRLAGIVCLAICLVPRWSEAQLAPPNDAGITTGHMHLVVGDVQASKAFFVGLGGSPVTLGQIEGVKFPGVVFLLRQGEPTGGSAGSIVDHLGFLVKDGPASVERFRALPTKMETNILYIYSFRQPSVIGLINDPARSDMNFINGQARDPSAPPPAPPAPSAPGAAPAPAGEGGGPQLTVQGLPLLKPPYGTITATDLNKGEIVWQVAHGETPEAVRNHAALKGLNIPRTGRAAGRIGTLVTKTLVIAGEPGFFTMPSGQRGAMLRAYDKATGAEVGAVPMPAPQTGSPMTYMLDGRQYLAVPISGAGYSGELLVFRAPPAASTTSSR
jgi:hypothetical protein